MKISFFLLFFFISKTLLANEFYNIVDQYWGEIKIEDNSARCICLLKKNCDDTDERTTFFYMKKFTEKDEPYISFKRMPYKIMEINQNILIGKGFGDYKIRITNKSSSGFYLVDNIAEKKLYLCRH